MKRRFTVYASSGASQEGITASEYQILKCEPDEYDLAYGEGPIHDMEYWEDATLEDLRRYHQEDLNYVPDVDPDFDSWLQDAIENGWIRRAVKATKNVHRRRIVASQAWDTPEFDNMVERYMLPSGEGETMASQCATAINKLIYKWYNDGDVFDNNYGLTGWANDLSDYANWLFKYIPKAQEALEQIYDCTTDDDYENLLRRLVQDCCDGEDLEQLDEKPKQGSIYDCDGPFSFEEIEEDEDDDYDYDDDYDDEEEYDEEYD